MEFREKGRFIQLVRKGTSPEGKRLPAEIVGRIRRELLEVPDDVRAALTAEEAGQLDAYLREAKERDVAEGARVAATLPAMLTKASKWLATADAEAAAGFAKAVRQPFGQLRRSLSEMNKATKANRSDQAA